MTKSESAHILRIKNDREQIMSNIYSQEGTVCPFCAYTNHVEEEDYSEDEREEECGKCGLLFVAYEEWCVYHISIKPSKK